MIGCSGVGHLGGSMSIVEILAVLYFRELRLDPRNPDWPNRDRFVLSKGHGCTALYAILAEVGILPREILSTLHQIDSPLQMHPERGVCPGIEMSTGALGKDCPPLAAWPWALGSRAKTSAPTPSSVTASLARADVGGGDVCGEVQAGQSGGHPGLQQTHAHRPCGQGHAARTGARQMDRLRLARPRGRWPFREQRDQSVCGGARSAGPANDDYCPTPSRAAAPASSRASPKVIPCR